MSVETRASKARGSNLSALTYVTFLLEFPHSSRDGEAGILAPSTSWYQSFTTNSSALAGRCLYSERPGHTLRATALVHEAYMRLVDADVEWQDRAHFYAIAARVMRRILVEYARAHTRHKRGGGNIPIPLDEAVLVAPQAAAIVEGLDEALKRLANIDARKSEILQLLFFGGLTYEETAAALHISPATVHRELKLAKAWLLREMEPRAS